MTHAVLATIVLALATPPSASTNSPSAPPAAESAASPGQAALRGQLETAFGIASLLPSATHGRDKAKLQAMACEALVRSGEIDRAIGLGSQIDGWRRGETYAVAALALARQGKSEEATMIARRALGVAPSSLDWQRERIQVSVARVYAWIGDEGSAAQLEKGVGETEVGRVAAAKAGRAVQDAVTADFFEAQMKSLDEWIKTKNFDLVKNSVEVALEFYPAAIADPARRSRIETLVDAAIEQVPYDLRIRFHLRMADALSARGERDAARARIGSAEAVVKQFKWLAEDEVVQRAAIAESRIVAGDADAARAELDGAVALFDSGRAGITDIYRARPLRAVAAAYMRLGDEPKARATYLRALDEGAVNPNARPRAEDLVATLVSMSDARLAIDEAASARVEAIRAGLVDPW